MRQAAAKQGDRIVARDTHTVVFTGEATENQTHSFSGPLQQSLSPNVRIQGRAAAVVGSVGINTPRHAVQSPALRFQHPPSNRGTVVAGSRTVFVNGKPLARGGDPCRTCQDPRDLTLGKIQISGPVTVFAGG